MEDPIPVQKDPDLAIRLMLGEEEAFRELIRTHGPKVKGYLESRFVGHVADEAWSDAIRNVWKNADDYDETKGSLGSWFLAIAHNAALDIVRQQKRQARDELGDDHPYRPPDRDESDDDPRTKKARENRKRYIEAVRESMNSLTDRQRTVIEADLAYLHGDVPHTVVAPGEELAEALNTSKNNIYKLRHDARAKLKTEMLRRGFFAEGRIS